MVRSTSGLAGALLVVAACSEPATLPQLSGPLAPLAMNRGTTPDSSRFIVILKDGVGNVDGVATHLVGMNEGRLIHVYRHALKGFAAHLPLRAVEALRRNPTVAYLEQDRIYEEDAATSSWALDRLDQMYGTDGQFTLPPNPGAGTHIYIIDSGIRSTHSEFGSRVGTGHAVVGGDPNQDSNGHGTAVASVAAGATVGVARSAIIHSVRVRTGTWGWVSDAEAGIDWVTGNAQRPAIINFSAGAPDWVNGPLNGSMDDAIRRAVAAGIVSVVSAGNDGEDACDNSPAKVGPAISVGSSTSSDTKASFSAWGSCVDIYAPGVNVPAAGNSSDIALVAQSGTSVSAPLVAGVAALYLGKYPSDGVGAVTQAILDGARVPIQGYDQELLFSNVPVPVYIEAINGPTQADPGTYCSWAAVVRGGRAPFQISWSGIAEGTGSGIGAIVWSSGYLDAYVTDALGGSDTNYIYLNVSGGPTQCYE